MVAPNLNGRLKLTGVHQKPPASFNMTVQKMTDERTLASSREALLKRITNLQCIILFDYVFY